MDFAFKFKTQPSPRLASLPTPHAQQRFEWAYVMILSKIKHLLLFFAFIADFVGWASAFLATLAYL